jgi:ABC-2 type transport system permease protein
MKNLLPLMQREWLQHRFGWMLMVLVPIGLALLLTSFGQIEIDGETIERSGQGLAPLVAMASMAASMATLFLIAWISSFIIVSGLARRDHADRSIEFWMSLPATHSESLAAPLLVHLLLVPAAALLLGWLCGWLVSMVTVSRVVGIGALLSLPWIDLALATFSIALRLVLGLALATAWLLPLILLVVLMTAWFKRWGWVILAVGVGLGSLLLRLLFGQPLLSDVMGALLRHAGKAMITAPTSFTPQGPGEAIDALRAVPGWALHDFGQALADLASPLLPGGLLFAAGCFALLVLWRQRGAGGNG